MIDRLVTAGGAVAAAADRAVRAVVRDPRLGDRRVSLVVAAALLGLAGLFALVALETSVDPAPRPFEVGGIDASALGPRTHAAIAGGLATHYVETFEDLDIDGEWDEGEPVFAWEYYLVDPVTRRAVTVASDRSPDDVYRFAGTGTVVHDPAYVEADLEYFEPIVESLDLTLDRTTYIDATTRVSGAAHDLSTDLPAAGAAVAIDASRTADYLEVCGDEWFDDTFCTRNGPDRYDVIAYDPASRRAVIVAVPTSPEADPTTLTGVLRRDARAVSAALDIPGIDPGELPFEVDPALVLDEGAPTMGWMLLLLLALGCVAGAAVIAVGALGGYVVFRPTRPAPAAAPGVLASTGVRAVGERRPLRITGRLRSRAGIVHVREAPASLVRFALGEPTTDAPDVEVPSTLIVERDGQPEGVAVGRGEVTAIETGTVASLGWVRPAIRATAGTGPVILTFDQTAARDAAAAAIIAEAGLDEPREGSWTPGS